MLRILYDIYLINKNANILNSIKIGYDFFVNNLLLNKTVPKQTTLKKYPIDIHNCAEIILCCSKLNPIFADSHEISRNTLNWLFSNMYCDLGYFYYRKYPIFTSKTPFMRWGQAWMLYAVTEYLLSLKGNKEC